ncbi:T9SS type A sorting domain-containing protein, partial [Crocinitomicaceae bacterium]|nr:T9SS type A sorting domain-containing protein [Crocinitomicaceae bacterium]
THVLTNAAGCDSTVTLDLTINNSTSSSIQVTSLDIYTAPSGAVYTFSGTYIDIIPNVIGCDSTITIELTMNYTSIEENQLNHFKIYPNPSSKTITISISETQLGNLIEIVDGYGRIVMSEYANEINTNFDVSKLVSGLYHVRYQKINYGNFIKN